MSGDRLPRDDELVVSEKHPSLYNNIKMQVCMEPFCNQPSRYVGRDTLEYHISHTLIPFEDFQEKVSLFVPHNDWYDELKQIILSQCSQFKRLVDELCARLLA